MTKLLISLAEKRKSGGDSRDSLSNLSGYTCVVCNIILFAVKLLIGTLTGSVSVTADAVNNLSDSATNIVTIMGTKLSKKPVDKEHPFGHGRIEYISALIVAISIFVMSFELAKASVEKIINPQPINFAPWYLAVLTATVLVKLWMALFNARLFKLTDNVNLKAVRQDSLNDCIATLFTIISVLLTHAFGIKHIDGIIGVGVSIFIFISGIDILKSAITPLLGEPPSKETVDEIERIITDSDIVLGVHDLIIHNYGVGNIIASAHAEVSADADVMTIHDAIDAAEHRILDTLGITICIHMDPVAVGDADMKKYIKITESLIAQLGDEYTFHDFRIAERDGSKCLNFDLAVPFDDGRSREEITEKLTELFEEKCPEITLDINVEHPYI